MIRSYILQIFPAHNDVIWCNKHYENIVKENPDNIMIFSLGEIAVEYIWGIFLEKIQNYLIDKNIPLYILWAGPNLTLKPNVHCINTLGSAFGNQSCTHGAMSESKNINLLETAKFLYTCYNNNAKYERKFLVDMLVKYNLKNDGIITYHYPHALQLDYQWQYHDGSRLVDEDDYVINSRPEYTAGRLPKSYFNGFIDIVCETSALEGYFIPTEKTAKPLGAFKPFLVLSSKNYHKNLYEEYGIKPYDEIFNYNFDNESKIENRAIGIIENLIALKSQFKENKHKLFNDIKDKLEHNRNCSLNQLKILQQKNKTIPDCLKFITEQQYELLGDAKTSDGGQHFLLDPEWHKEYG